jgi:hypothetical protein
MRLRRTCSNIALDLLVIALVCDLGRVSYLNWFNSSTIRNGGGFLTWDLYLFALQLIGIHKDVDV